MLKCPPILRGEPGTCCGKTLVVYPLSLMGQWSKEMESRVHCDSRPSVAIYYGRDRLRDPSAFAPSI